MKSLFWLALAAAAAKADLTPQGPAVEVSRDRSEIVLNGMWSFQPAATAAEPDPAAWGEMPAPGSWVGDWRIRLPKEPAGRGTGEAWKSFGKPTVAGWYERTFTVPAEWSERKTLLQVGRVSTDALVWIDGKPAGVLGYLGGELDLTGLAVPGKESRLRIFVVASKTQLKEFSFANPVVPPDDGGCASKGITGDIVLINRPAGARVDHVAVLPSVRKSELGLVVELADATNLLGREIELATEARDAASGQVLKSFTTRAKIDESGVLRATFPWQDARRWDTDDPFLHRLTLTVKGDGIDDQFTVPRFGFREFWAEGRDLFLNGSLIRLRPGESAGASNLAAIRADLSRRFEQGHNILEIWPQDTLERGFAHFRQINAAEASKAGMLLMMPTVKLNDFFNRGDDRFRQWAELAKRDWRDYVNEPSIVIMVPSGNMQWLAADLNPAWLGRADVPPAHEYQARDWAKIDEANAVLRAIDPTRLIMHHQGGPRGDIAASNTYLLWAPLQEREEWPRAWADRSKEGVMPFSAIEFGTPLDCSFFRNRNGFGNAYSSEALMTEYAAIYLGPAAYETESDAYRDELLVKNYQGKDPVTKAARWPLRQNPLSMVTAPAFQEIQRLFQRNSQRAWRTWGLSGGMVPWNEGFAHRPQGYDSIAGLFTAGDRGSRYEQIRKTEIAASFHDASYQILPAAEVLDSHQQPTLAWIAGKPSDWTEKGHHFRAGETLEKSVALINDSRREQDYVARWELKRGNELVDSKELAGRLAIGEILLSPLSSTLPPVTEKTELVLHLKADIGGASHQDQLAIRVWPKAADPAVAATLYDPVGKTGAMLKREADPPATKPGKLVVIGREALSSGLMSPTALAELQPHVAAGNTLLIMAQDPEWMRRWWGFRLCQNVARRVWPVNASHPLWQGIDAEDLLDWRGAGTLLEARPERSPALPPLFMFRWGNQGSVSSAAVEKPHLSGWTPLLQGEFDLQYSPLMELRHGKGRVILCLLDLEDQAPLDPAARDILDRLLRHASEPIPERGEADGIAPNDLPPRIAAETSLRPALMALQSPLATHRQVTLADLIEPLKTLHQLADEKPWLRLPRWRLTRVEHQLRANAGESFPADDRIFHPRCDQLDLSGPWLYRPISRLTAPAGKPLPDSGLNDYHKSLCQPKFDAQLFIEVWQPEVLLDDTDGDAIIRRTVEIPAHWQGKSLVLDLGVLQSSAVAFFDGRPLRDGQAIEAGKALRFEVPAELVKGGTATVALRLWNAAGPGGHLDPAATRLHLGLADAPPSPPLYHPDYRADFRDGDDPYRFFRW